MESSRRNTRTIPTWCQVLSFVLLIVHLLLIVFTVKGQAVKHRRVVHTGHPVHSSAQVNMVRKVYTSQIGVREKQPNSGTQVEKYLRYVNLPAGSPWCAAFVCWVFGEAGVGNPRSGWSPALFGEGSLIWPSGEQRTKSKEQRFPPSVPREQGTRIKEQGHPPSVPYEFPSGLATGNLPTGQAGWQRATPGPGDIFGLFFPEKARIAHVGFIDEWNDPWVVTVEGNTNVLGSREGDGVYRKRRLVRTIYKVARYVK